MHVNRKWTFCIPGQSSRGRGSSLCWPVREAPPEMGIFFRLQVYERVEISLVEVEGREI